MSMNIAKLNKLSELVSLTCRRKPIVVLNPEEEYYIKSSKGIGNNESLNTAMICDKTEWKIPEEIKNDVEELTQNGQLSNEEKILLIYEKICHKYAYDDNILSYIIKNDEDKFDLPDWYGRDVDIEWEENRETHNRRVCYEISRNLAKSLTEILKSEEKYNICILWDKDLTHYFVGLNCKEYSLTLDLDEFNKIKDLTRLKSGLTAEGIVILEDKQGKFTQALNEYNNKREKYSINKIESEIEEKNSFEEIEVPDDIIFFKNALEILKDEYDMDPQGIFEYMKEIADIKLGPENRAKVWKKKFGESEKETRYMRCLLLNVEDKKYIIDVEKKELRSFDEEEFTKENAEFIPYKHLHRDWDERYNGI